MSLVVVAWPDGRESVGWARRDPRFGRETVEVALGHFKPEMFPSQGFFDRSLCRPPRASLREPPPSLH